METSQTKGFDDDNVEQTQWKWRTVVVWFFVVQRLFLFFFVVVSLGQLEVFVNVGY